MSSDFSYQDDPAASFEEVWKNALTGGTRPRLKEFLNPRIPPWAQKTLLQQLLEIELAYRRQIGEQPEVSEYTQELIEYKAIVETLFQQALESTRQSNFVPPSSKPATGFSTMGSELPLQVASNDAEPTSQTHVNQAKQTGPYILESLLGEGAFGQVWLAIHTQLREQVAVKVLTKYSANQASALISEAKTLLPLVHPNIIRFYHAEVLANCSYIAMEYVSGGSLKDLLRSRSLSVESCIRLITQIAEGLGHAHKHGVIHRDLKPANILLTTDLQPKIADFGMAMNYSDFGLGKTFAGTPNYMSPEQARGESHRVDGRSDIFALGVILYELLTRTTPFGTGDVSITIDRIIRSEPRPPRQINAAIPIEIERICLKCLEKKLPNRYGSTAELLDDLNALTEATDSRPYSDVDCDVDNDHIKVMPRGLRAFESDDADFFLRLWPGPRDRHGNPEIIRLWKSRLESKEVSTSCSVGVVYGPSGSGKSSLLRAGLLPKLDKHVDVLLCDANSIDTEDYLAESIRDFLADEPSENNHSLLPEVILAARQKYQRHKKKLLIVIDQLEQYLHANPTPETSLLASALRQCDGCHVQTLLIVRDDFWLSLQRLMLGAEIPLREGINMSLVDRFDKNHGKKVLKLLGEAYERLPSNQKLDTRQNAFLENAVELLSESNKLTAIQMSIFVESLKHTEWTLKSLQRINSVSELGIFFLDDCFGDTAPMRRRVHARAAMQILEALAGTSSHVRSVTRKSSELQSASGYAQQLTKFNDLMSILVNELRLLSPAEKIIETLNSDGDLAYQLSHDFLVPAVNVWLQKRRSMSRSGRAQLLLESRAKDWQVSRANRALPDFFEYLSAMFWTFRFSQNAVTCQMLRRCHILYGRRIVVLTSLLCAILLLVLTLTYQSQKTLFRKEVEYLSGLPANQLASKISELNARSPDLFKAILDEHLAQNHMTTSERARLLVARLPSRTAAAELNSMLAREMRLDPPLLAVVIDSLNANKATDYDQFQRILQLDGASMVAKFHSAITVLQFEIGNRLLSSDPTKQPSPITLEPEDVAFTAIFNGINAMEPVERRSFSKEFPTLVQALRKRILDKYQFSISQNGDSKNERLNLINVLTDLFPNDPSVIIPLVRSATKVELERLLPVNSIFDSAIASQLSDDIESWKQQDFEYTVSGGISVPNLHSPERDFQRIALANLIIASLANGNYHSTNFDVDKLSALQTSLVIQDTKASPDYDVVDRSLLGELLYRISDIPTRRSSLLGEYVCGRLKSSNIEYSEDDIFYLFLVLGRLATKVPNQPWLPDARTLAKDYQANHPDAGIHSAASWLLTQLAANNPVKTTLGNADWRVSPSGQLMIRFDSQQRTLIGSPTWEPERDMTEQNGTEIEHLQFRPLPFPFEIAATEVTNQFFKLHFPEYDQTERIATMASDDSPAAGIRWKEAAEFCNRLSRAEGIPPEEWAYDEAKDKFDITKTGYRLPTAIEWEHSCRGRSMEMFAYGNSSDALVNYAWFIQNSMKDRLNPVGQLMPNRFGLFDMHGNIAEYCADDPLEIQGDEYRTARGGAYDDRWSLLRAAVNIHLVNDDHPVVLGSLGFRVARTLKQN